MKFSRKLQLTFYSIFSILTFHKYYICEECHKIHKRIGNEIKVCGGWYKPHVFVSQECAHKVMDNALSLLRDHIFKKYL